MLRRTSKTHKRGEQRKLKNRTQSWLTFWSKLKPRRKDAVSLTRREKTHSEAHKPDGLLLACFVGLTIFGWVMVYSSSFYVASQRTNTIFYPNNPFHFFILQFFWIIIGAILAFLAYKIPFKLYSKLVIPALLVITILLIITLVLPRELNGAKLWIKIGPFTLQPSEFAKPILIIYLAGVLAKPWQAVAKTWQENFFDYLTKRFLPFAIVLFPIIFLVFVGKDLAGAGVIGFICLSLFFLSDNNAIHNLFSLCTAAVGVLIGVISSVVTPYRLERVQTYLKFLATGEIKNPLSSGFQLQQILIAVGTGGLFGYGFGQSYQKYFYLQETAFSDTIFAVIAEEFGLIGSLVLISVFLILIFHGLKIAQNAPNKTQALTALGIVTWFALQIIVHLGVNVGLIPLTGITLPFISYGGSSMISCLIGAGILLNISKQVKVL